MENKDIVIILQNNYFTCLDILKTIYSPDSYNGSMYDRLMNGIQEIISKQKV
jgi:hypothetical protein